tara:strand:- start:9993 stop:10397 length:405 start_codon:yes stop_codon:yes gene_type:complete
MPKINTEINCLDDFKLLRTSPKLDLDQSERLLKELDIQIKNADWLTIGIMAPEANLAVHALREIERHYELLEMKEINQEELVGPVFLKANQNSGHFHLRIEYGLGDGILISCQYNNESKTPDTFGPFPLSFFEN